MKTYPHKLFFLFVILIISLNSFAQNKKIDSLKQLAKQYKKQQKDTLLIKSFLEIAYLYNDIYLDSSDVFIDKAQSALQKINWSKGPILISRVRGHYYFRAGLYDKALEESFAAQKMAENLNDLALIASMDIRIGTILTYLNRFNEAQIYLTKGALLYRKIGRETDFGVALANLGDMYLKSGAYKKAISHFRQCMIIINKSKDSDPLKQSRIVAGNNLLAVAYLNAEMPDSSKICEKICTELGEKIHNNHNLFDMYLGFAKYYLKKNNRKLTDIYAKKSLEKAKQLNSIEKQSAVYKILYENNKLLNNISYALNYLELHKKLEDSIQRANVNKQIAIITDRQELIQQKSQIQSLTIKNLQQNKNFLFISLILSFLSIIFFLWLNNRLKIQNKSLSAKNQEISEALLKGQTIERQRVAMDLHDNLGSTLSALWLSLDTINQSRMNAEEKEIHQNLRENLEKAYNDVRLLSHNLLPEEFEKQGLVPTLQSYVRKISKSSKIAFDLKIAEGFGRVDNKIEFELYSICLELVNNIIKHSQASDAKITLTRTEKQIKMTIADNGIGIFNNESDGKGMKNVKARVDSLNGVWDLKNIENQGTTNSISIPV